MEKIKEQEKSIIEINQTIQAKAAETEKIKRALEDNKKNLEAQLAEIKESIRELKEELLKENDQAKVSVSTAVIKVPQKKVIEKQQVQELQEAKRKTQQLEELIVNSELKANLYKFSTVIFVWLISVTLKYRLLLY